MKKMRVVQIGGEHDHAPAIIESLRRQSDLFDVAGYVLPADDPTGQYEGAKKSFDGVPLLTLEQARRSRLPKRTSPTTRASRSTAAGPCTWTSRAATPGRTIRT